MPKPEEIRKGNTYWCVHRRLAMPKQATVIALTDNAGKQVGVQFDEDIQGHNCDGRGEKGRCLWMRPFNLYTDEEYEQVRQKLEQDAMNLQSMNGKDIEVLG
jgi:predicted nuclease of predicted toxin-antitoxin system